MKHRFLIVLAYFLGGLLLAELFYRFFWQEPPRTYLVEGNHPFLHHIPIAFEKGGLGEFDFRGRKITREKTPGTLRVVFMGDSFTYGFTNHDQTIPVHFEALFHERFPDKPLEILNFGFVSYSPIIHNVQYQRLIRELKPDWVIYLMDTCDPIDDVIYRPMARFDASGDPVAVVGERFLNTGWRRSALIRFVQFAWTLAKNGGQFLPREQTILNRSEYIRNPESLQYALDFSFDMLKRLTLRVQADGFRMALFQYPWPFHLRDGHEFTAFFEGWGVPGGRWVTPEEHVFGRIFMEFCRKNGFFCHDFAPEVRRMEEELGTGSRLKIYNNYDNHFTGFANRRFAGFILDRLFPETKPSEPIPNDLDLNEKKR